METNQTYQNELGSAMLPFVMRELVDTVMKRKKRYAYLVLENVGSLR